jgi:uncharacterized protein (DUF362 family)
MGALGATAGTWLVRPAMLPARPLPTSRVAVGACREYGPETAQALARLFDQLGGLGPLVRGKTVAVKLSLPGPAADRLGYLPQSRTHWVHPQLVQATVHLLGQAGARRIRLLESPWSTSEPLPEFMLHANWEPRDFLGAAPRVELQNTNYLGRGRRYAQVQVPGGGLIFPAYDIHPSYADCDVFLSLAKLKQHRTLGIALSMNNLSGMAPCTLYREGATTGVSRLLPADGRGAESLPRAVGSDAPQDPGQRVPRLLADLAAARPVHLAILDGIETLAGGEGPWCADVRPVRPGLLVAGTNCVATDAVGMALMGFDCGADYGVPPFLRSDSMLRLAQDLAVGSRDLKQIEVLGTPIAQVRFNFGNGPAC